jgi:hypothetical protein
MTTSPQSTTLTQIKHINGSVLYECEIPTGTPNPLCYALEQAVREGANLAGANLTGANLARANLARANLAGSYLAGADLTGANLTGANLAGSYLTGANLIGANLARANLAGSYLAGADLIYKGTRFTLTSRRPVLCLGPIGSRSDYVAFYLTDKGIYVKTGCFFGSMDEFKTKLHESHEVGSGYREEYEDAILMAENKAKRQM